jgi:integrase
MPQGHISKRSVDALTCPNGKDYDFLWDDSLSGFGVKVYRSGKKTYVVQFRQHGRTRRDNIGEHGRITPEEGRSIAKVKLGQAEQGIDPIEERRKARAIKTLREAAAAFLEDKAGKLRPGTVAQYKICFDHILPSLGSRRLTDIKTPDIALIHRKMAATPRAANHMRDAGSSLWGWLVKHKEAVADANPFKDVEKFPEEGRERYLTTDELSRLGSTLTEAETIGLPWHVERKDIRRPIKGDIQRTKLDSFAVASIRLLLLTGARLREILHLEWSMVDFEKGMLHLPTSKTGRKSIIVGAGALAVLASLPRVDGSPFVIPGRDPKKPRADLKKPWKSICHAAAIEGLRLHDLRHSFASVGAGGGLSLPVIGALLGHASPDMTARYAHLANDPARRAADTINATIMAAMNGDKASPVIPLPKRKK